MNNGMARTLINVLCLVLLLSGCGGAWKATKKMGKVVLDPEIQVGDIALQPSAIRMTLVAEPDVNPNEDGEATPIELAVVYLKEDSKLLAADYDLLESAILKETLGKNYLDHQEYTLLPNQYKPLQVIKLEDKTAYLAIVAYYADANRTEWKKIIKVKDIGHNYNILVHLRTDEIDIRKEEE